MLLQTHGVRPNAILEYQRLAVRAVNLCVSSWDSFVKSLRLYSLGHSYSLGSIIEMLHKRNIIDLSNLNSNTDEPMRAFILRLAEMARLHVLRDLKHHARIPIERAWTLVGVADEWDELEEGQVYGEQFHRTLGNTVAQFCTLSMHRGSVGTWTGVVGRQSLAVPQPYNSSRRWTNCRSHRQAS